MKRFGFGLMMSGLVLAMVGCDDGDPCATASDSLAATCMGYDTTDFVAQCGRVTDQDACRACVEGAIADGATECGTIVDDTCATECCPGICNLGDSGPPDAGARDGGPDAGPPSCTTPGRIGAVCRGGTTCVSPLTCEAEFTTLPMSGAQATLGNLFEIPSGTEDPDHPGEYFATGPSDVPVNFAPGGGQCTQGCAFPSQANPDDGCGSCASCSNDLGGSPAFGGVGIAATIFTQSDTAAMPGICRLNCQYDPATNGGCPTGYSCDVGTNICIEACVADSQCNVDWGISRSDGLVAYDPGAGATCNMTTGRCDYAPPAGAGLNTPCENNFDCPQNGLCLIGGYCATLACATNEGAIPGPHECAGECIGFGGNNGSVCVQGCMSPDDCFPGQACSPFNAATPSGATGFCFGVCDTDAECRSTERCREIRENDPDTAADESLSTCSAICDPDPAADPVVADAVDCGENEVCIQATGVDHGYCEPINQLCFADDGCNNGQACEVLGTDQYGRCVDGCTDNSDCASGDFCRIQPDSETGVCRTPGGECSRSPDANMDSMADQPLLGNAQCVPGQTCSSTTAGMLGTCMGMVPDGGTPMPEDAGTDAGAEDAGVDAGGGTLLPDGGILLPDGAVI